MNGSQYLLSVRVCADHTIQSDFDVQENRSTGLLVRFWSVVKCLLVSIVSRTTYKTWSRWKRVQCSGITKTIWNICYFSVFVRHGSLQVEEFIHVNSMLSCTTPTRLLWATTWPMRNPLQTVASYLISRSRQETAESIKVSSIQMHTILLNILVNTRLKTEIL